jgi:hypothetical protein
MLATEIIAAPRASRSSTIASLSRSPVVWITIETPPAPR